MNNDSLSIALLAQELKEVVGTEMAFSATLHHNGGAQYALDIKCPLLLKGGLESLPEAYGTVSASEARTTFFGTLRQIHDALGHVKPLPQKGAGRCV
ncbi:MAG: hypothetical protein K2Q12_07100 [Rickettsiales bacterium]|nr:hypothetical protein [Rickettsiales bacterium]